MKPFQRDFVSKLAERLNEPDPLIQVVVGPRQVGKTTGIRQLITQLKAKAHYANADDLLAADRSWLLEQWQQALLLGEHALLVIDEVQKVSNWPETIKALWDKQPIHQVARPAAGQREYRRMTARSKWEDFSSSLSVLN